MSGGGVVVAGGDTRAQEGEHGNCSCHTYPEHCCCCFYSSWTALSSAALGAGFKGMHLDIIVTLSLLDVTSFLLNMCLLLFMLRRCYEVW